MSISPKSLVVGASALVLSPLLIVAVAVAGIAWLVATLAIMVAVLTLRTTRGIAFLIVYSDSLQWRKYFAEEVVPSFGRRARVINLSTDGGRKKWWHLDWLIYRHCAGYRDRFPIVLRFSSAGTWRAVRFHDAFLSAKKGQPEALAHAKAQLLDWKR